MQKGLIEIVLARHYKEKYREVMLEREKQEENLMEEPN